MIKLIDRYLTRSFLQPLVYCLLAFIILFLAYDLSTNLDTFFDREISVDNIIRYYIYQIPIVFSLTMPFTTLLALLYCLGNLSRTNEIIAMRASGITLFRIIRSYLIIGFIMFLITFVLSELFVPRARRLSIQIMPASSSKESLLSSQTPGEQSITFYNMKDDRQWVIGYVSNTFHNVTITQFTHSKSQRVRMSLEAREAEYVQGYGWWFYDVTEIPYFPDGTPKPALKRDKIHASNFSETPAEILSDKYEVSLMDYTDMLKAIKHKEIATDKYNKIRTELYNRISTPFACFVFVLLAAPFGIFHTRAGMMKGVLISIALCLLYYIFNAFLINLGKDGVLPPVFAAWTGNVIFIVFGGYLLYRMR